MCHVFLTVFAAVWRVQAMEEYQEIREAGQKSILKPISSTVGGAGCGGDRREFSQEVRGRL